MSVDAPPVLLVHGGAGALPGALSTEESRAARQALAAALRAGRAALAAGAGALDAVVAAVSVLEDDPAFNAGRGAVYTFDGGHELDAAVMEGETQRAGSVAGVRCVRNPVQLARAVMEQSAHVMLAGEGAEAFAREVGVACVDHDYFDTPKRLREWQQWRDRKTPGPMEYFGTVGAVARDAQGRLAAATSTGGMTGKRWGRIGDTPVIGAGTFADAHAAVSCTGWGEFYLRTCAAHALCTQVASGLSPVDAAEALVLRRIPALGGSGGVLLLAADGRWAMPFSTAGMFRGHIGADGPARVAIGPEPLAEADPGQPGA